MLGILNQVAIAVPDLAEATAIPPAEPRTCRSISTKWRLAGTSSR